MWSDLSVTALVLPDLRFRDTWLAAVDEFLAARRLFVPLIPVDDSGVWFEVPNIPEAS